MSRLSTFFHGADTQLGVFYPTHYLVAVFPSLADAEAAGRRLSDAGVPAEDVISVSGQEAIGFAGEHFRADGLWGVLMTQLSRSIGAEAVYTDQDLAAAAKGAAFLGVYCPTTAARQRAWRCIEGQHPIAARYYAAGGIEHLAGEV